MVDVTKEDLLRIETKVDKGFHLVNRKLDNLNGKVHSNERNIAVHHQRLSFIERFTAEHTDDVLKKLKEYRGLVGWGIAIIMSVLYVIKEYVN